MAKMGSYDQEAEPESRDAMPEHECTAAVTESDFVENPAEGKDTLKLTWTLLDGPFKGRKVWQNLLTSYPDKQVKDIANAQFAAIRIAMFGNKNKAVTDTAELHNIPCKVKVTAKPDKRDGKIWNNIGSIKSTSGATEQKQPDSPPWTGNKKGDRF